MPHTPSRRRRAGPQADRSRPRHADPLRRCAAQGQRPADQRACRSLGQHLAEHRWYGAITAGRLIGRTGRAGRFPSSASFANYAGAAPVEIASAAKARHRLSRGGDSQLNSALHTVAITQIRTPSSRGHTYYNAKIAQGKTAREAR